MPTGTKSSTQRRCIVLAGVGLGLVPWSVLQAQGMCSVDGLTLDEALAAWRDAAKKAQMDKDSFLVTIERKSKATFKGKTSAGTEVEAVGVLGTLSINGSALGDVLENEAVRIAKGEYRGVIRYYSKKNFVQGPLGTMGEVGDFLLEVVDATGGRTALLIHTGTKPWHSAGCVLAGAAKKTKVDGKDVVTIQDDSTLRKVRKAFYGTDGTPNVCPNKTVRISIKDI